MSQTFFGRLDSRIDEADTRLCVGLDPRTEWVEGIGLYNWAKNIVDQTKVYTAIYKPNFWFWLKFGFEGFPALIQIIEYIQSLGLQVLLDIKAGDIGSTATAAAAGIFDWIGADASTLNPYLGKDSVAAFLADRPERAGFVLARTSNPSAADFQDHGDPPLYLQVAGEAAEWNRQWHNVALVAGATYPEEIVKIRSGFPGYLLIPGIGPQGGQLEATVRAARSNFVINASRGVTRPKTGTPAEAARDLRDQINQTMVDAGLL